MNCSNDKPNIPCECGNFQNNIKSIYVNPKTMEAFDSEGKFIGIVDLDSKPGIAVLSKTKSNGKLL